MVQAACRIFLWTGRSDMSKRALVAWEKVCLPQQAGGLNITDMKLWNQAAICKPLWSLTQKKDKTWIKWVHGYYIKTRDIHEMPIPRQCSWIIQKILGAREYLRTLQDGKEWLLKTHFSIRELYKALVGEKQKVEWAKMICQNAVPPKCIFISWLLMHERLVTCGYLQRIGVTMDHICCLCD